MLEEVIKHLSRHRHLVNDDNRLLVDLKGLLKQVEDNPTPVQLIQYIQFRDDKFYALIAVPVERDAAIIGLNHYINNPLEDAHETSTL